MSTTWATQSQYGDKHHALSWTNSSNFLDNLTMKDMDMLMDGTKPAGEGSPLLSPGQPPGGQDSTMFMDIKPTLTNSFLTRPNSTMDPKEASSHLCFIQDSPDDPMSVHGNSPEESRGDCGGINTQPLELVLHDTCNVDKVQSSPHGQKRSAYALESSGEDNLMDIGSNAYRNPTPERDKVYYSMTSMPCETTPERDKVFSFSRMPLGGSSERDKLFYNMSSASQGTGRYTSEQGSDQYGNQSFSMTGFHGNGQGVHDDNDVEFISHEIRRKCLVCGDEATGMYFGALVCVPCKTFFLRYAGENFNFVCKHSKNCEITISTRTQCKYCRYQKCINVGMCRRERPAKVELLEGQQLCVVCQDVANGVHFGAITCEGCKKFFRRGLKEHASYTCKLDKQCEINPRTRNSCRYCRYMKCILAGMSREAIQMGRPSKFKPLHVSSQHTPPATESGQVPFQFMCPPQKDAWLSVNTEDGGPPLKLIKEEPPSPSSMDSYQYSPQMPRLTSPGLMMQQLSPIGRSPDSNMMTSRRTYPMLDMSNISPGLVVPISGVSLEGVSPLSTPNTFIAPGDKGTPHLLGSLNQGMSDSLMHISQHAAASAVKTAPTLPITLAENRPAPAPDSMLLSSPSSVHVPRNLASRTSASQPSSSVQSQFASSHPEALSGGVATFFNPVYVQDNKRYITDPKVYNAFVQGALDDKVKLKEKPRSRKSSSRGASGSSTSSRMDLTSEMEEFLDSDMTSQGQMATLNQLTLPASCSMSSLKAAVTAAGNFPSEPSTPALSSPSSPGRLELPGISDLDSVGGGTKSDTVDYILFSQLLTPPTVDSLDSKDAMLSPHGDITMDSPKGRQRSLSPTVAASQVPSVASGKTVHAHRAETGRTLQDNSVVNMLSNESAAVNKMAVHTGKHLPADPLSTANSETSVTGKASSPMNIGSSPPDTGPNHYSPMVAQRSPISEVSNKSPGSSSSSSSTSSASTSSSQFGDNGSVYDFIIDIAKKMDLVKRREDSDSEGSEKDLHSSTRNLLSQDTPDLNFKNFEDYWLKNTMPDENIMFTPEHSDRIFGLQNAYRNFVETGTKINKRLRKELDNWMMMHEGQYKAPPAWINEKVVPIYTLMSVTYCRNLPGFVDFDKQDQSTIIKLGQSQSRILVAARHWFDPELNDFRDFMSWRGAKTGTGDDFKKRLIEYAKAVQKAKLDDMEAAILNVLVLIATDYPELQRPEIITKYRQDIMNQFRAYTTAIYGTPNTRMEELFQLVPTLRELGLQHHRMTFHMRSARTTSSSSNT